MHIFSVLERDRPVGGVRAQLFANKIKTILKKKQKRLAACLKPRASIAANAIIPRACGICAFAKERPRAALGKEEQLAE